MRWTEQAPTQDGYYWWRQAPGWEGSIVWVRQGAVYWFNCRGADDANGMGGQWWGPIPQPGGDAAEDGGGAPP
jgi:hypothetical protein